jgi:hypothetical protein
MQLPYLIRAIESHAQEITRGVVDEIRRTPQLPYLHGLSDDELRTRGLDFYSNLGQWLGAPDDKKVSDLYRTVGYQRCEDGVPAAEVVYAVLTLKRHLWDFIRNNSEWQSEVELYQQDELISRVSHYFDVATYNVIVGHEDARMTGRWKTARR